MHNPARMAADDSLKRFGGIARLYGNDSLERYLDARVAVVGIGGVGSWAVEALARSGIGNLLLIDLDEICLTNVNRQLHAMDAEIGRQKTAAMADRVKAIHPACRVQIFEGFFNERSAASILDGERIDFVIDAIDSLTHKALLIAETQRRGIPLVVSGAAGGRRDATRVRRTDLAQAGKDPLLRRVRRLLREVHHFPLTPPRSEAPPWGITAVFSDELPVYPANETCAATADPANRGPRVPLRLGCDTGYGSAAHVTATFGLVCAAVALDHLAATPAAALLGQ